MSGLSTTSRIFSYYPLSISSVSQSNGPSTKSYHSNSHNSSNLQSNLSNKNKYSKLQGPRLPSYLIDTTFADLYIASSSESYTRNGSVSDSDQASFALPTAWNIDDRSPNLELSEDRLRVNYTGSGKNDSDAAAIRANFPMPPQCGLFYFEVDIISKGREGFIGIGFCGKNVQLNRLPGWENMSWGYHGDDGHLFCCSGTGKPYGPQFTTGDVIGCCVNFRDGTAFYTKNGAILGTAFRDLKGGLYPSIGLRTPNESVEVNFGQKEFKFAIDHYMKEQKALQWQIINTTPMPPISSPVMSAPVLRASSEANLTTTVHQLIFSYLVHHGFSETAKAFYKDAVHFLNIDSDLMEDIEYEQSAPGTEIDMLNRQRIRNAVLRGDIDQAIKLTNALFPSVLPANDDIHFRLRCREFIEMMGRCSGARAVAAEDEDDDLVKVEKHHDMIVRSQMALGDGVTGQETDSGDKDDDEDEEYEDAMDVDDFTVSHSDSASYSEDEDARLAPIKRKKNSIKRKKINYNVDTLDSQIETAMKFGQKLQQDYQDDTREEIKSALEEAFSLLAYSDPANSVVGYLLHPSGREPVANALNSAILASQGKPAIPQLERIFRQTSVTVKELSRCGVGTTAFVNVNSDCLAQNN
ncbi:4657_t:CDS:2 [Paraglomus brasilianum]|uniref:4657_t:CDS:1 n=1 Tax=Paraglomus brasilianum TaxID=144538 RepID=A0A9N9GVD0_9GLOM|nr:4657_t:CDS:2 [Paraglomus brasilianum]